MDNLPIGVAVNTVDPMVNFIYMNDNFPKFYRTTREALIKENAFWDSVYEDPDYRHEIKKRVLDDCATDDPGRMQWEDVPITRKGEETTFICAKNTPIPGKKQMISIVWDVTERKRAEKVLRESEEKYRSMMEAMTDSVYICSADFRIIYMNPTMIKMIGHDATGELCHKSLHGNDEQCSWCLYDKVQHGESFETEIVSPKNNRSYNVTHSPIFHEDGTISKMTIYKDITVTKQLQHQLFRSERLSATGQLAATIAHEINSPLQGIISILNLVERTHNQDEKLLGHLNLVKGGFINIRDTVKNFWI